MSSRFRNLARLHTWPTRRKHRCSHLVLVSPGTSCERSPIQLTRASTKSPADELGQRDAGRNRHQPNRPHANPTAVTVAPTFPILLLRIGAAVMPSDRLDRLACPLGHAQRSSCVLPSNQPLSRLDKWSLTRLPSLKKERVPSRGSHRKVQDVS